MLNPSKKTSPVDTKVDGILLTFSIPPISHRDVFPINMHFVVRFIISICIVFCMRSITLMSPKENVLYSLCVCVPTSASVGTPQCTHRAESVSGASHFSPSTLR